MVPNYPDPPPFTLPDREGGHPGGAPAGRLRRRARAPRPRVWIGFENTGGGSIPDDYAWTSNPKQVQDDLGSK
jgi:hypothetical protein